VLDVAELAVRMIERRIAGVLNATTGCLAPKFCAIPD